eukprot:scaffold50530_cov21-Phaeocystis_antarctica.AAC.1
MRRYVLPTIVASKCTSTAPGFVRARVRGRVRVRVGVGVRVGLGLGLGLGLGSGSRSGSGLRLGVGVGVGIVQRTRIHSGRDSERGREQAVVAWLGLGLA